MKEMDRALANLDKIEKLADALQREVIDLREKLAKAESTIAAMKKRFNEMGDIDIEERTDE
jgi:predicted  nucleic acid-binding Zn-ribbon protein